MKIFCYDGSVEGMLSAFRSADIEDNDCPEFFRQESFAPDLFSVPVAKIASNKNHADEFLNKIEIAASRNAVITTFRIWMSDNEVNENSLYRVLRKSFKYNKDILSDRSDRDIELVCDISSKVSKEIHR